MTSGFRRRASPASSSSRNGLERLGTISAVKSIAAPFVPLTLFLFARPRNGFAGLHELISGTRVVPSNTVRLRSRLLADDPHAC